MVQGDVGDDAGQRRDDVRRVQPSAEAGFPDDQVAFLFGEKFQRHDGDDFKKGRVMIGGKLLEQRLNFRDQPDHFIFGNQLAVDLDPLAKRNQVRRGEQADAQAGRAINAFQHRAGRAFAVGAGDVDEAEFFLRIARERGELAACFPARTSRRTVAGRKEIGWRRSKSAFIMLHSAFNLPLQRLVVDVLVRGGDEALEQRMRLVRLAQKFRMELAGDEKRMVLQLDDFDQFAVRRKAAENKAGLLEFFAVGVVEFVAVAVAFVDDKRAVKLARLRADDQLARLRAEPHRAAFFGHFASARRAWR